MRIRLSGIAVAFSVLLIQSAQTVAQPNGSYKIFDGVAKKVIINHSWSWGLGHAINDNFFTNHGYSYITGSGSDTYNYGFLTENYELDPNSWVGKNSFSGDNVIFCLFFDPPYIQGPHDTAAINRGVRKIEAMRTALLSKGVKQFFAMTRHYTLKRPNRPTAIDDSFDTLVVQAYNRKHNCFNAVNIRTPTRNSYPYSHRSDVEHGDDYLKRIYALSLMTAMLQQEGRPVPSYEAELTALRQNEIKEHDKISLTVSPDLKPKGLKIGDQITIDVKINTAVKESLCVVLLTYRGHFGYQHRLAGPLSPNQTGFTKTITIPDSAELQLYGPASGASYKISGDSARILVTRGKGVSAHYQTSYAFKLLNRNGSVMVSTTTIRPSAQHYSLVTPFLLNGYLTKSSAAGVFAIDLRGRLMRAGSRTASRIALQD